MYNSNQPSRAELPSTGQLLRSTLLALIAAVVILLTVVLPAEYALDPTGVGRWLGLTEMGEIKQQLAEEAERENNPPEPAEPVATTEVDEAVAPEAAKAVPATETEAETEKTWRDEVRVTLTPGQGTEFKLVMNEGDVARFSWEGIEGPLNYDTHGNTKGQSVSYEKGRGVRSDEGELTAAFTGKHGWFFRNRTSEEVTLVLRLGGDYQEVKRML
ncbi:transmembrane anchor protein [Marinospirillum sp.]|uniref:transmembrane anchor protein n=1 Tax=Marinospirillum sp. TaxID=2183934 RepID=UPI0028705951|nr:transmembrane anchor protein [Marinospirillum sp.]MDR9468014.1 transmembrane anchor protein [Marinospirillum sp.]